MKIFYFFIIFFICKAVYSQSIDIKGKIIDFNTKKSVSKFEVFYKNYLLDFQVDDNDRFTLNLPNSNICELTFTKNGYCSTVIKNFKPSKNQDLRFIPIYKKSANLLENQTLNFTFEDCSYSIKIENNRLFIEFSELCRIHETYCSIETLPEFPGGEIALRKYFDEKKEYPEFIRKAGINGKVFVSFIIDFEENNRIGEVNNAFITKGLHPLLDNQVINLAINMPSWKSGLSRGIQENCFLTMPVKFGNDAENNQIPLFDTLPLNDKEIELLTNYPTFPDKSEILKQINLHNGYKNIFSKKKNRVVLKFSINACATPDFIQVIHSTDTKYDEKAINIIKSINGFTEHDIRYKDYCYIIPIDFY